MRSYALCVRLLQLPISRLNGLAKCHRAHRLCIRVLGLIQKINLTADYLTLPERDQQSHRQTLAQRTHLTANLVRSRLVCP